MQMDPKKSRIEQLFLETYDIYADAIFRYCYIQTSDRELAKDLTQESFAKFWQYMQGGKEILQPRPFLYKIAANLVIDYRRKKKTVSLEKMMEQGFDYGEGDEAKSKEIKFEGEKAIQAIKNLDEKYRDVLTLRYVDEMSIKEIAGIVGESENNVSVRIHRGLEKLRELVAR